MKENKKKEDNYKETCEESAVSIPQVQINNKRIRFVKRTKLAGNILIGLVLYVCF